MRFSLSRSRSTTLWSGRSPLCAVGKAEPSQLVASLIQDSILSSGQSLDAETRAFMEPRFGHDFSQVRIHADEKAAASARAVNALAYTVGRDVVFGVGNYAPSTPQGYKLLAHELTHVIQQGGVSYQPNTPLQLAAADSALERQAESAAAHPVRAGSLAVGSMTTTPSIQRAVDIPASPAGSGTTTTDDNTWCAGWFADHESLSKRAAENYVHTELKGNRGAVEQIECDLFDPGSGAYACTVHFSDGTPIRVIARKDAIIVGVAPIQSMYPPPDRPLCWYGYTCVGANRELVLTKRKCQSAKPAGGSSPGSSGRGPNP